MVLDTSALVAMLLREPLATALLEAIEGEHTRVISSVSVLERESFYGLAPGRLS